MCARAFIGVCMRMCVRVCLFMCVCVRVCVCACVRACVLQAPPGGTTGQFRDDTTAWKVADGSWRMVVGGKLLRV